METTNRGWNDEVGQNINIIMDYLDEYNNNRSIYQ